MMAAFVPKFEGLKLQRCRVGQDARNTVDGNMITGRYARNLDSTITAFGFSGHSFMHGLAAGRALSELAWTGAYQKLGLSLLHFERIQNQSPLPAVGIR